MARTTAPLLGFDASGQMAKSLVYAKWRGVRYARRYVIPGNPRSVGQTVTRTTFATLREMWKRTGSDIRAPWTAFAKGRPFLDLNAWVGENMRVVRAEVNFQNFLGSPGAKGGLPPVSVVGAAGTLSGEINVEFVHPTVPPDWTLVESVAMAFPDQDPADDFVGPMVSNKAASPATTVVLAGLGSAIPSIIAGWLVWTKPNGETAYSVGLTNTATSKV